MDEDGHKSIKMKKTTSQTIIENLSKERYGYIYERNDSWDEEAGIYSLEENPKIDQLADEILDLLKKLRDDLPFEFIFDELTKLGQAPCLLYDDNGYFAISASGYCSVNLEPDNWEGSFFVQKNMWKDSIREALNYYLDEDDD